MSKHLGSQLGVVSRSRQVEVGVSIAVKRPSMQPEASSGVGCTAPRVARPLRIGLLKIIDVYALFFFAAAIGVVSWHYRDDPFAIAAQATMLTFAVLGRAVIVPSTAFRTAWISFPAYLPVFLAAYLVWTSPVAAPVSGTSIGKLVLFVLRGLMGVTLAAITSKIIFGLRREVRNARRLGQYVLEEKIGEGGMGEVYRASHAMLRRPTPSNSYIRSSPESKTFSAFKKRFS